MNIVKKIADLCKKSKTTKKTPQFAFCESIYASSISPWHIRELTYRGLKLSGGADTKSLCDREMSWDLDVEITPHHLTHCCNKCAQKFKEI
jgi:hypothetical protein